MFACMTYEIRDMPYGRICIITTYLFGDIYAAFIFFKYETTFRIKVSDARVGMPNLECFCGERLQPTSTWCSLGVDMCLQRGGCKTKTFFNHAPTMGATWEHCSCHHGHKTFAQHHAMNGWAGILIHPNRVDNLSHSSFSSRHMHVLSTTRLYSSME